MFYSFNIYIRAVGIYALLTLPAFFLPMMYLFSMLYVLLIGWFAWAVFAIIYALVEKSILEFNMRMLLLGLGVIPSVAFAFQMLEVTGLLDDIWDSGGFLLFPALAVVSGWISLFVSRKKIMRS